MPATKTNHANFIPEIVLNNALGYIRERLSLARFVTKDTEIDMDKQFVVGEKLQIPKRGTLTANARAEDGNITLQSPTADKVEITLDQLYEVAWDYTDMASAMMVRAEGADNPLEFRDRAGYFGDAVAALVERIETSLFELYASMSVTLGSAGATIDEKWVSAIMTKFDTQKAPVDGRFCYVDATVKASLLEIDRFTSVEKYGNSQGIVQGELGTYKGIRFVHNNLVQQVAGAPIARHNIALTREGIVLCSRQLPKVSSAIWSQVTDPMTGLTLRLVVGYNSSKNRDQIILDALWGCGLMREEWAFDVLGG